MRKDRNSIDPAKPALIVTYGSCPGKVLQMDRELLVIGRAPACDLVLNSPEVSPVHCLIVKTAAGWLLRNTNPRAGTQLNGEAISDVRLSDDDSLQIGTFSFKVHLPGVGDPPARPPADAPPADAPPTPRRQPSREKLVRLAWSLRRRLLQQQPLVTTEKQALADRCAELEQRTLSVDARQRECENLLQLLVEQEDAVNDQRQALVDAAGQFETTRRQAEDELARHVAEAELHIRNSWEQCQAQRHEVDALAIRQNDEGKAVRELELRRVELDHYAEHLRRLRLDGVSLPSEPVDHDALWTEVETVRADLEALRAENAQLLQQITAHEGERETRLELERQAEQLRTDLEAQRSYGAERDRELERLWQAEAEWRERAQTLPDLEALCQENQSLQAEKAAVAADLVKLRDEHETARAHLAEEMQSLREKLQAAREDGKRRSDVLADAAALRAENEQLHQQVIELGDGLHEKGRLQARVDEQLREVVVLRERLQAKDDELRRLQVAVPPEAQEHAELVTAVETLLRENDEFRHRLLSQARMLRENEGLQQRFDALQGEVGNLHRQLEARHEELDIGALPAVGKRDSTAPVKPNAYLRQENEDLKALLAVREAALADREQLLALTASLQAEVDALRARPDEPKPASGWHELVAPHPTSSLLAENETLRSRLSEQQNQIEEAARLRQEYDALGATGHGDEPRPLPDDERGRLTARIAELEEQIRERDLRIAELQAENEQLKENLDYDNRMAYEGMLARDREALVEERAQLEQELATLRDDRRELDAAAQSTELQIARDRVQITREWAELNRKREEFRMDVEKEKRETVRDNLERVRRIKEEGQVKHAESLTTLVAQRIGDRRKAQPANTPE